MSGKPLGIGITAGDDGIPRFYVTPINRVTDQIWDAVRDAICANMTPQQFREEVAQAWKSHLEQDAKAAVQEITGRRT